MHLRFVKITFKIAVLVHCNIILRKTWCSDKNNEMKKISPKPFIFHLSALHTYQQSFFNSNVWAVMLKSKYRWLTQMTKPDRSPYMEFSQGRRFGSACVTLYLNSCHGAGFRNIVKFNNILLQIQYVHKS